MKAAFRELAKLVAQIASAAMAAALFALAGLFAGGHQYVTAGIVGVVGVVGVVFVVIMAFVYESAP